MPRTLSPLVRISTALTVAAAAIALLGLVPACGGGGGGGGSGPVATLDLGFVDVSGTSRVETNFLNAAGRAATVTQVSASGPFRIDPASLPATAPDASSVSLPVLCEPANAGHVEGLVTLRFDDGAGSTEATYRLFAWAEPLTLRVLTATVDFGARFLGEVTVREVRFENRSAGSVATISRIDMPSADFRLVGSPLPITLPPGESASVDVRFSPIADGPRDGRIVIGPTDRGGPLFVDAVARGRILGRQEVVDFGEVTLDAYGRTPDLTVDVPEDAISLSVEAVGASTDMIGLDSLIAPGGQVYENPPWTGPYLWGPKIDPNYSPLQGFMVTVPNSDRPGVQLVPGGGTWTFRLWLSGGNPTMRVRAIVVRRAPEISDRGVLDLNVFLAAGIPPTAATASSDTALKEILGWIETILGAQGIRLGDVTYYKLTDTTYDDLQPAELDFLFRSSSAATEERLNLFFVKSFSVQWGLYGVAGCVDGPRRAGTAVSGVACAYLPDATYTAGLIAAHEIGHYLGLWHPYEPSNGPVDPLDDTPTDNSVDYNLMAAGIRGPDVQFWGTQLTASQGMVMRGHPHVRMDPDAYDGSGNLYLRPDPRAHPIPASLPKDWCGVCRRGK